MVGSCGCSAARPAAAPGRSMCRCTHAGGTCCAPTGARGVSRCSRSMPTGPWVRPLRLWSIPSRTRIWWSATRRAAGCWPCTMASARSSPITSTLSRSRLRLRHQTHLHPGAGPRHLAFPPGGAVVYVVNEADSTVTACRWDADSGRVEPGPTVRTVPADSSVGNYPSPSAVLVSPDGRFVYVANRFHDSVAVLATEPSLRLVATYPCGGEFPRDMVLGDGGRLLYVANEHADSVTGLVVDPMDGGLAPADWAVTMPRPTCVLPV